jgi:hypothetical protein
VSIQRLVAGTVKRAACVNVRSADAAHNEFATAIMAAEDCIDPRSAAPLPRAVEVPGSAADPDLFDEAWEGGRAC